MSEHVYLMTNEALQDAIINTNVMLKVCPTNDTWRHDKLKRHFQELLENQKSRAKLAVYNPPTNSSEE